MRCSLIICTYNWPAALGFVLNSVALQSEFPDEIIIADDGSGKLTEKVIKNFSNVFNIPIIHSWQEDIGCRIPHSRNRAIAKSTCDYIIMIDGDTVLHKHFIKDHKSFAKEGVYIQGSRVLLQDGYTKSLFSKNLFQKPSFFSSDAKNKLNMIRFPFISVFFGFFKNQDIARIRGCNFSMFRRDIFKVNGFNEEITSWGREDSEFVQRLFNSGILKRQLKFSAVQYHLFHNERVVDSKKSAATNNIFLKNAKNNKLVWCDIGLNRYF
jgi:glycosyltransferase involved in cell wall biosynthesis